jgi:hypothetical protein
LGGSNIESMFVSCVLSPETKAQDSISQKSCESTIGEIVLNKIKNDKTIDKIFFILMF